MTIPEGWESGSGSNRYFLAESLRAFRHSVNVEFPNRDYSSDGWIGDAAHAARVSDHNPCWTCSPPYRGIVRAIDVDIDGREAGRDLRVEILNSTIGHPAVWYVISNGKIYSRTYDWKANDYTGTNGHFHHVHISLNHNVASYNDSTLVLKKRQVLDVATLDSDDLKAIRKVVSDYAVDFWVAPTGTGTAIRKDISAIKAAVNPEVFAAAVVAKLPAGAPIDGAAVEAAVRAVFADAGDATAG